MMCIYRIYILMYTQKNIQNFEFSQNLGQRNESLFASSVIWERYLTFL